jgi:hypothetical protein
MILPTYQNLNARAKDTGIAPRLENLRKGLQLAYKTVRENRNKSYQTNKKYYDRKAKDRTFKTGDIVYLYNPAKNSHMPKKFRTIWDGPYKVKSRKITLNYLIENEQGKEQLVHINRLKKTNNPGI